MNKRVSLIHERSVEAGPFGVGAAVDAHKPTRRIGETAS
jgi:hypothetical protein